MGTTPKRETLIALRARRTAHQVAQDVLLAKGAAPMVVECKRCKTLFVPVKDEQLCAACTYWRTHIEVPMARRVPLEPATIKTAPPTIREVIGVLISLGLAAPLFWFLAAINR